MSESKATEPLPPSQTKRRPRWLRWVGAIAILLLFGLVALYLGRNHFIKGYVEEEIKKETGLKTTIGSLNHSLTSSELVLNDLRIHNPPGYDHPYLLHAPRLVLRMDSRRLSRGELHFRQIDFHLGELTIVRNTNGNLNIDHLSEKRSRTNSSFGVLFSRFFKSMKKGAGDEFVPIDELVLRIDKVGYVDLARPRRNKQFDLGIKEERVYDIHTEAELNTWIASFLLRTALHEALKGPSRRRIPSVPSAPRTP